MQELLKCKQQAEPKSTVRNLQYTDLIIWSQFGEIIIIW